MLYHIAIIMCACTIVEMLNLNAGGGLNAKLNSGENNYDFGKSEEELKEHDIINDIDRIPLHPSESNGQYCKDDKDHKIYDENSSPPESKEEKDKTVPEDEKDKEDKKNIDENKEEKDKIFPNEKDNEDKEDKNKHIEESKEEPEKETVEASKEDKNDNESSKEESKKEPMKETVIADKEDKDEKNGGEEEHPKINPELEKQYSPLLWAKNYKGNLQIVIEEDTHIAIKESEEVNYTVPHTNNIRYGKGEHQLLDIYGENSFPEGAEILVFVQGISLDFTKESSSFMVKPCYESGVIVVTAGYDKTPKINLGEVLKEFKELADFVFSLAEKYKCRSIWFGGHSIVGAQGIAQLLFDDYLTTVEDEKRKLFKGVVLISGLYDLRPIIQTSLYAKLSLTKENIEQYSLVLKSNELNIARNLSLKVIIVSAEYDSPAFYSQTQNFAKFLTDNKINHEYAEIADEDHISEVLKLYYFEYELTQKMLYFMKIDNEHKKNYQYCHTVEKYCSIKQK